jgi:hypothetical protein
MFHYFFNNLNKLFLICALAFISIANAQEVRVIDNKGTIKMILKQTIAELYDISGGLEITSNADILSGVDIIFDTQGIIDLNDYEFTTTSIKVKKAGTYKVTYRVTAEIISALNPVRTGTEYILLKDNAASNFTAVDGSYSAVYHRSVALGKGTASASRILVLEENEVLKVKGNIYSGPGEIETVANGSSFLVERIK